MKELLRHKRRHGSRLVGLLQLRRPQWLPTGEPKFHALHGWRVQDGADGAAGGGKGGCATASGIAGCGGRGRSRGDARDDVGARAARDPRRAACVVRKLSKVQLKCGPRSAARQQFLVRGSFLVDVEDGDEEEDDAPEPNTFWVHQADLLETIAVEDVEEALEARQEAVMAGLRPAKKARK
tara:strand:+ start:61 stop:603 length:543 start_codon:yes stop_codon:yes gene_type:complete